jgi:hypothetical protein
MPLLMDVQVLQLGFTACRFIEKEEIFIDRYVTILEDPKRSFSDISRYVWTDFAVSVNKLEIEHRLPRIMRIMRDTVGEIQT